MRQKKENKPAESVSTGFVAEYCGVSNTTVLRWLRRGYLGHFRLPDGHYRIRRSDLRRFLKENNIPA